MLLGGFSDDGRQCISMGVSCLVPLLLRSHPGMDGLCVLRERIESAADRCEGFEVRPSHVGGRHLPALVGIRGPALQQSVAALSGRNLSCAAKSGREEISFG